MSKASDRGVTFSQKVQFMLAGPSGQVSLESLEDAITSLAGGNK